MKGQSPPEKVSRETKPTLSHTVGIARVDPKAGLCVVLVGEREICECYQDGEVQTAEDHANAERIVACWNAYDNLVVQALLFKMQRDDLMRVLRNVRPHVKHGADAQACATCGPGNEGAEIWGGLLGQIDKALRRVKKVKS